MNNQVNVRRKRREARAFAELFDWIDAVIAAIVIVVLIFTFAFRVVGIKGTSM